MTDLKTMKDLWAQNTEGFLPVLVEIYNPDISWSDEYKQAYEQEDCYLRLISNDAAVKYQGKKYLPCAFAFTPPETDGAKVGTASISITAFDAKVKAVLVMIRQESKLKIQSVYAKEQKDNSNKSIYRFFPLQSFELSMTNASSNPTSMTFNLIFKNSLNQSIPYDIATMDRVPSTTGE